MRLRTIATALFLAGGFSALAASAGAQSPESASVDPALEAFITRVRAVDNHTHVLRTTTRFRSRRCFPFHFRRG
jgi:hypothetical protein